MADSQTKVTVGSSTTEVKAANLKRCFLALVNDSDEAIYIKFGAAAVMNEGYRLNASGGSLVLNNRDFIPQLKGAVNAICASGSKNLSVIELELA